MSGAQWARPLGLLLGYGVDRLLGDPRRYHPVAGLGRLSRAIEDRSYRDRRAAGVAHTIALVGGAAVAGGALDRVTRERPYVRTMLTAVATWTVLGGRTLEREAMQVSDLLRGEDLPAARRQVSRLVGRDPSGLDADEIARATIESVAENSSDAVVAPLCAGAVGGIGGLLGYRVVNTLDAMIGHRNARYRNYGWAAARLDDAANLVPARLTAALTILLASTESGAPADAWRSWRLDARQHPSPNAGPVEAAFAGALGVRLGGRNTYGDVVEERGVLGDGRLPRPDDIARATRLARRVSAATLGVAVLTSRFGSVGAMRRTGRDPS
ncbi:MAG: cobalamin biosynthesis protein [Nocardioidaceae bacterium]